MSPSLPRGIYIKAGASLPLLRGAGRAEGPTSVLASGVSVKRLPGLTIPRPFAGPVVRTYRPAWLIILSASLAAAIKPATGRALIEEARVAGGGG